MDTGNMNTPHDSNDGLRKDALVTPNKLSLENVKTSGEQCRELILDTAEKLILFAKLLFNKAVENQTSTVAMAVICKVVWPK